MAISYPRELVFGLPEDDPRREAITRAAAALALQTAIVGGMIQVTVTSPTDAYRFGQKTREFMQGGQSAPTPATPRSEEALEHQS
jgi:hypothetical protein